MFWIHKCLMPKCSKHYLKFNYIDQVLYDGIFIGNCLFNIQFTDI